MNDDVCYKTKLWKFDFEVGRSFASARSPEREKKFLDIVISTKKKKKKNQKKQNLLVLVQAKKKWLVLV